MEQYFIARVKEVEGKTRLVIVGNYKCKGKELKQILRDSEKDCEKGDTIYQVKRMGVLNFPRNVEILIGK